MMQKPSDERIELGFIDVMIEYPKAI